MLAAPNTTTLCLATLSDDEPLIALELITQSGKTLRALMDSGASNNFVREQTLVESAEDFVEERSLRRRWLFASQLRFAVVRLMKAM